MGSIRLSSVPSPSLAPGAALARRRAEAVSHVGPHQCRHVARPHARWRLAGSLAAADDLLGHDRRDHHPAAPARRRRAARAQRCGADQDLDLRRRLLCLWGPDPLADRVDLLLRARLHQDGAGQPRGLPVRRHVRELIPWARLQAGLQRSSVNAGDSLCLR